MKQVRVATEPILGEQLQPGDLFSIEGPRYWDRVDEDPLALAEKVWLRTNNSADSAEDKNMTVYKLTIIVSDGTQGDEQ